MFRASSMGRIMECPYSETIPHERDTAGDAAMWGTRVHRWMETRGAYTPEDVGDYEWAKKVKYCKDLYAVAADAFGWNDLLMRYEVNVARELGGQVGEFDGPGWPELRKSKFLSGTIDMLRVDASDGVVTVRDLKTGSHCPEVEGNKQLLSYAACVPLAADADWTFSLEILHWPYRPYSGLPTLSKWKVSRGEVGRFVADARKAYAAIRDPWSLSPNVGDHCAFCPGKGNCEGWV